MNCSQTQTRSFDPVGLFTVDAAKVAESSDAVKLRGRSMRLADLYHLFGSPRPWEYWAFFRLRR
jgi:hypothetical protein